MQLVHSHLPALLSPGLVQLATALRVCAPKIKYLEALEQQPLARTETGTVGSLFLGKCEQICLELTWHPYGESKPCDPDSLFPVVKSLFKAERWELAWEEIYLSYWPDLLLCNFRCGCIYFYENSCSIQTSQGKTGEKEQTVKRPLCQKKLLYEET